MSVRTEITEGLAARVLLDYASNADLLVLGRMAHDPDQYRGACGHRARPRAAPCPVVVIGQAAPDPAHRVPESWQRALDAAAAAR